MTYWLLTTEYPPFYGGGISTYCYFTARMLAAKGHDVTVFVNDSSVKDIRTSADGSIRLVRFNPSRTGSSSFLGHTTNISYEFAAIVKHFVQNEGAPDVIEAQEYLGIAYYLLQFKHLQYEWCRNIAVVVTIHSPSFLYMEYNHVPQFRYPNFWICEMERFCLQAADLLIAPSEFILDELQLRFQLNNPSVSVVPNPYDIEKHAAPVADAAAPNQIVFYGKLTVQKGAFKLLQYFSKLWDEGFAEPLYLIGGQDIVYHPEGRTMGEIIRSRYKHYLDKGLLKMESGIRPSEIGKRLSLAKLVIIPSDNDNLPYVGFEMMGMGKVVLVSKQGGHAAVVDDGVDGFIFDHNEPETFFEQLRRILKLSEEEREAIGASAVRKIATLYNMDRIYGQKIELITKCVASASTSTVFPFVRTAPPAIDLLHAPGKEETEGLLSIVVPYYNMGHYIDETIQSLQSSNYKKAEIIIVNDGSKERASLEKLNKYRHAAGIRVIDTENKGLAHARNRGAVEAKGQYLAFMDADDLVDPDYYTKAIRVLQQHANVYFVGAWTQYFEGSRAIWPTFPPEAPLILYHNLINSSSLVYRRAAFLAAGKNDGNMVFKGLEDYDSVISMVEAGLNGVVLPEPLFHYRVRKNSMIREISSNKKLYLLQYISQKHKAFYNRFATEVYNLQNANGPGLVLDNPTLDYHLSNYLPFAGRLSMRIVSLIKGNKTIRSIAYRIYKTIKS